MKILYEVLNELEYISKDTFTFSCSINNNEKQYEALSFVSLPYPSQVYLVVQLTNSDLDYILGSSFLISLAKEYRKQPFHRAEMDKNTTLLFECVCSDSEFINLRAKVQIEDDPYYFKKYVFSYSVLEDRRANEYLQNKRSVSENAFSFVNEVQLFLLNADTFASYKDNHSNQPTYSYFTEFATKVPIFPLKVVPVNEIKTVDDFLNEELQKTPEINVAALDQLLNLKLDFKEETVDTILGSWNTITLGAQDTSGQRFTDSKRIEGTLPDMLAGSLSFVQNNMRISTRIDPKTGARFDTPQYPMDAIREAILNALVHRDYSIHTEGMPIQLIMYSNRIEIKSPGGLYGRLTIDQLGKTQPDTRNPVLVTSLELIGKTENRYSGIPRIRNAMSEMSLPAPVFSDHRGEFSVCMFNTATSANVGAEKAVIDVTDEKGLLDFCKTPKTRTQIVAYLGFSSSQYALRRYLDPLVESGAIVLSRPDVPHSPYQKYTTAK